MGVQFWVWDFFICFLGWVKWVVIENVRTQFNTTLTDNVVCFPENPWMSVQHDIIFMFYLEPTI